MRFLRQGRLATAMLAGNPAPGGPALFAAGKNVWHRPCASSLRACEMTKRLLSLGLMTAAIVAVHFAIVRPWFLRWGATDREVAAVWAGDEFSADADM